MILFVNGVLKSISSGTEIDSISTSYNSSSGTITILTSTFIRVVFRPSTSSTFGCYYEYVRIFIPNTLKQSGDVRGLMGTPNGNAFDDWTSKRGAGMSVPTDRSDRLFEQAYNYCTTNWCIFDSSESILSYEDGTSFDTFNLCSRPYKGGTDFGAASQELQDLCVIDAAYLADGLSGDITDAQTALQIQAEQELIVSEQSFLQFDPSAIQTGSQINVLVTMDISQLRTTENVNSIYLYRVDTDTGVINGDIILILEDDGSNSSSDAVAGDFIFSNALPVRSDIIGETLSFRAVPVIDGNQDSSSPLVTTSLNAVRYYSEESGVGTTPQISSVVTVNSLEGLELFVQYSWSLGNSDLDTSTRFLDGNVGYSCNPESDYITFGGDSTGSGGVETATVRLYLAETNGAWSGRTNVSFYAG